ncbi:MAG: electron transport complex subunit RsxC [Planctomycetota bacterium]|jgi:electron transport complex protein RnfC
MSSITSSPKGKLTFPSGTHPPEYKELTNECAIEPGPDAKEVSVMLTQHIGAPCEPIVKKGDTVEAGQKIGDSEGYVSAPVHSPVDGKVKSISLQSHAVLGRAMAITIEADAENNPAKMPARGKFTEDFDEEAYTAEQICDAVRQGGLVGMGGAGFPTRVKIEPNPRLEKEYLIVNGCECEPYITCDYRLMLEWTNQVLAGIKLARKASGCKKVFIGIEDNKPEAIEVMRNAVAKTPNNENILVVTVKTKYPQGGERQLIRSILKKNVPTGGIPPMIGVVVVNVATAAALAEAVVLKSPLTHRVVTMTGQGLKNVGNYYTAIGTPIEALIEMCGGFVDEAVKVLLGGPMMGLAVADLSTPVTKTTGAVTILTEEQIGTAKFAGRQTPCIRCGRCLEACPENLNPTRIAHAVKHNLLDLAEKYYINACIECGCCSYVCPANIEITGHIKTGKIFLARQKKKMPE